MKLNVSYPANGSQKTFEIDDEKRTRFFLEKRMGQEVLADPLGDMWKGYVFRINGGHDKQGFPMKQGVLTTLRVRLLLKPGQSCYRGRKQKYERKRKSVRGCIIDPNQISVLNLSIVKRGESEIEGVTDVTVPRRLGPKRASKIRKLFNLTKEDDPRDYIVKKAKKLKNGKIKYIKPKVQRLVTPRTVQHAKRRLKLRNERRKKSRDARKSYDKMMAERYAQLKKERLRRSGSKAGSSRRKSQSRKSESSASAE